ncbi:MAG: ATP-binding cassette domain-containing protein [Alistipes sp.]|nr:ATP-binding cassette domain-containing protein [Alistipes sp.]
MLKITNLSKKYKNVSAIEDFNLELEAGHIYGIVGPNGAGKTTFFKILAGLAAPSAGEVTVSTGEPLEKYREKMSFMIESPYLYDSMTALENMKIIGGIKGETDENKLKKLLELVKLDKTHKKKVKQFSLGMRQRLGIACALASDPEVLVLDEPMNGVDPEGIVELREMLLKLRDEKNMMILISSHILGELSRLSTDFIFVKEGRILKVTDRKFLEDTGKDLEDYYMKEMIGHEDRKFVQG